MESRSIVRVPRGPTADDHPLMTITDAAKALGCSAMTIRRRVDARQFPAVRIGCKTQVPRAFVALILRDALAGRTVVVEEYAARWAQEIESGADEALPTVGQVAHG